jgi:hypothetical protein
MADRYWVGGTTSWNGTAGTKWALTSGGAGGEAEPTTADDVYFDAASGAVTVTATSGAGNCRNLNFTGFTGTFTGSSYTMHIMGSLTLVAGMTWPSNNNGLLSFEATDTGHTIDFAGITLDNSITFAGVGGGWSLASDLVSVPSVSTSTLTLTNGAFNANGFNVTIGSLSSNNSNTRTLTMGSGQWTVTNNNGTIWSMSTVTGLTITPSTLPVLFNYSGSTGTRTLSVGALTESQVFDVHISAGSDLLVISGSGGAPYRSINFTGYSGQLQSNNRVQYGDLTYSSNMTFGTGAATVTMSSTSGTKTITSNGNTANENILFSGVGGTWQLGDDLVLGPTSRTITLTSGTFKLNGFDATASFFASTNSNIRTLDLTDGTLFLSGFSSTVYTTDTFTNFTLVRGSTPVTLTYTGSVGSRTVNAGTNAPEAIAPDILVQGGTDAFQMSASRVVRNLDFGAFAGNWNAVSGVVYGNLTLSAAMTVVDGAFTTTLGGADTTGTKTITTNGVVFNRSITINALGGATFQLADALTMGATRTLTHTAGTFNANGFNVTVGLLVSSASNTRTLTMGSGQWTISGNNATIFTISTSTGLTLNRGPLPFNLSYTGSVGSRAIQSSTAILEGEAPSFYAEGGTDTITITSASRRYFNLDFSAFSGTLTWNTTTIYGSLTLSAGLNPTGTSTISFGANSGTHTITSAGKTLDCSVSITGSGVGGSIIRLLDDLTLGSTRLLTLTGGEFDANDFDVTTGFFVTSGTTVRSMSMGSGIWNLTGEGTIWNTAAQTNITLNAETSTVVASNPGSGSRTFSGFGTGAFEMHNLHISAGTGTLTLGGGTPTMHDLDYTGYTGTLTPTSVRVRGDATLDPGMTIPLDGAGIFMVPLSGETGTLTTNGLTIGMQVIVGDAAVLDSTVRLADDLTMLERITLTGGIFEPNGFDITCEEFVGASADVVQADFAGRTITVTGASDSVSVISMHRTVSPGIDFSGATIIVDAADPTLKRILNMADARIGRLELRSGGPGVFEMRHSGEGSGVSHYEIDELVLEGGVIVNFVPDFRYVVGDLELDGADANNIVTIQATVPDTTPWLLEKSTSGVFRGDYMTIGDSAASPGYTWYAGPHSVNDGGNTGWIFDGMDRRDIESYVRTKSSEGETTARSQPGADEIYIRT